MVTEIADKVPVAATTSDDPGECGAVPHRDPPSISESPVISGRPDPD
ncbi:hypothetical protein [Streptomyces sp. Tu 3180]|nr:hypothetical protein [Streptomyces sp. Tu 3180]KAF3468936.1 hypothetical protein GL259_34790 [Streptomyces sp. Tu 3180]